MNPVISYTFQSIKGDKVTVKSRTGKDTARSAAMKHFWGPPIGWCQNKGTGLSLIEIREEKSP